MSAGEFKRSKYQSDEGSIYRIRIQEETEELDIGGANTPPAGDADTEGTIRINFSRRAFGIKQRFVTIQFGDTPPTGYLPNGTLRVPILTETRFDAIDLDDTGTYLGAACTVIAKSAESVR